MEPQLPVRNQEGKFPVQIVSYSDSDWAGCQKSRKSTSGSLVSVFNVNLQSTSRTQASVAHSSAESELYAMTQAAVESLAIKNFIHSGIQFSSSIIFGQHCHSDGFISKKINGFKIGYFKEVKAH